MRLIVAIGVLAMVPLVGARQASLDVVLNVVVTDQAGRYLTALGPGDVTVAEEGVDQQVDAATRIGDVPVALTILVDGSNSMKGEFPMVRGAALDCVRRLRPGDTAAVVGISGGLEKLPDLTGDRARLERAINAVRQTGSTPLHAALFRALKDQQALDRQLADGQRRVILVLSDGDDTSSLVPFREVRGLARRTAAIVYTLGNSRRQPTAEEADLHHLAEDTGGRRLAPDRSPTPDPVCERLFADLSNQYAVRYVPRNQDRDGKWRRLKVRVSVPDARVWTRAGYFAPKG